MGRPSLIYLSIRYFICIEFESVLHFVATSSKELFLNVYVKTLISLHALTFFYISYNLQHLFTIAWILIVQAVRVGWWSVTWFRQVQMHVLTGQKLATTVRAQACCSSTRIASSVTSTTTAPAAAPTADHVTTHSVTGHAHRMALGSVFLGGRAITVRQVGAFGRNNSVVNLTHEIGKGSPILEKSVGFRSWSRSSAVSPRVTEDKPAITFCLAGLASGYFPRCL